jgi:HSP20 family molecular chaperone IbpA
MTKLTRNSITTEIDVPGMQSHLSVHTHDHTVVVDGRRHGHLLHRELRFPRGTDMRNVHAHVADGVLTISAPYGTDRFDTEYRDVEVRPRIWACHPDAAAI